MKTLHLIVTKKWFDLIDSGEKKEEYRDIKQHWQDRLHTGYEFKHFDTVTFTNGYHKNARRIVVKCNGITWGVGKTRWGASGETQFVIKLGGKK